MSGNLSQTSNERVVVLNDNEKINVHTYQQLYNEITGKNEEISSWYSTLYQIEFKDIEILNEKIRQHLSQFHVNCLNCNVRLFYENESSDTFSSFEKFSLQHTHSHIAVERLLLRYNLIIIHPETNKPQNYKIDINLGSRITMVKSFLKDNNWFSGEHVPFFLLNHASVGIEYVDYNVSKTLMSTIDDWFKNLHTTKTPRSIAYVQKFSKYIPAISKIILAAAFIISIILFAPRYFTNNSDSQDLAYFTLFGLISFYFMMQIGDFLGKLTRKSANSYCPLSYIKLNKADERLINDTRKSNEKILLIGAGQFILNIIAGVISSYACYILMNK